MPKLRIDNLEIEVPAGTTILQAARQLGLEIPTLCFLERCPPQTSCLVCVVKIAGSSRLVPSCATLVQDGLVVENDSEEVRAARRTALELLLADHAGECIAPCQAVCPAHLDIPAMIRQINAGQLHEALITAKQALVLPAVLGRICPQLCERGCRRNQLDAPVTICALHRHVADVDLASAQPWLPPCRPATGKRVAIVGAGPTGLSAAYELLQLGHACVIFDEHPKPGGALRYALSEEFLPRSVLDAEMAGIAKLGAEFRMNVRLGGQISLHELQRAFQAVLLAIGPVGPERAAELQRLFEKDGLQVDQDTLMTPQAGLFAAGSALLTQHHAVRAVAQGRAAATTIDQYLSGQTPGARPPLTVSRLGKLTPEELHVFFDQADRSERACAGTGDLTDAQAAGECHRCMNCGCSFVHGCKLRRYALQYQAQSTRFRGRRKTFERRSDHPLVVYEPGKCIACGLCVEIASQAREPLGLTWIGRGFDVKVDVPFGAALAEGLQRVARECAEACPTGAIAMKPV